jgi:heterodisulfide reductase subunit B
MAFSYFPGCSLKAPGHENNLSLIAFSKAVHVDLIELADWNCCGSSSAHAIDPTVAALLPQRNLSLAPKGRPLLAACPSCLLRLKQSHLELVRDKKKQAAYEKRWQTPFDPKLEIIHFFDLFSRIDLSRYLDNGENRLNGIRFAPYYGCMLARPPDLRFEANYHGLMENVLTRLGAVPLSWGYGARCCGTFLSAAKPDLATSVVNGIVSGAMDVEAECLVTACAMCHLNLEIRCTLQKKIPILHFSELLSLALGTIDPKRWFPKHLVDPRPLLKQRGLL